MLIIPVRDLAAGQASLDLDWQHASPTGGFVTSDFYPRHRVEVGHVVQVKGHWAVVQDIVVAQSGRDDGVPIVHLVTYRGCVCLYSEADGATVRTDYRVARWQDITRARAFAARWIAETERADSSCENCGGAVFYGLREWHHEEAGDCDQLVPVVESWPATDANLAQVFAGCVRPLRAELYPLLREQLADRSWLEVPA